MLALFELSPPLFERLCREASSWIRGTGRDDEAPLELSDIDALRVASGDALLPILWKEPLLPYEGGWNSGILATAIFGGVLLMFSIGGDHGACMELLK